MTELKLPQHVERFIEHYFNLQIAGQSVCTPYFINVKRVRGGLQSLVGKGSPSEIEEETVIYGKLRGVDLEQLDSKGIREFMLSQGIGLDCSGFIVHVFDSWLREEGYSGIGQQIKYTGGGLRFWFALRTKPFANISADRLTDDMNSNPVDMHDIEPGDLMRLRGLKHGDHVTLISRVVKEDQQVREIEYVHSARFFGEDNGMRRGLIKITKPDGGLEDQEWLEKDEDGRALTLEEYLKDQDTNKNGIRRPKIMTLLKR